MDKHGVSITQLFLRCSPPQIHTLAICSAICSLPSSSRLIWAACSSGLSNWKYRGNNKGRWSRQKNQTQSNHSIFLKEWILLFLSLSWLSRCPFYCSLDWWPLSNCPAISPNIPASTFWECQISPDHKPPNRISESAMIFFTRETFGFCTMT